MALSVGCMGRHDVWQLPSGFNSLVGNLEDQLGQRGTVYCARHEISVCIMKIIIFCFLIKILLQKFWVMYRWSKRQCACKPAIFTRLRHEKKKKKQHDTIVNVIWVVVSKCNLTAYLPFRGMSLQKEIKEEYDII